MEVELFIFKLVAESTTTLVLVYLLVAILLQLALLLYLIRFELNLLFSTFHFFQLTIDESCSLIWSLMMATTLPCNLLVIASLIFV